MRTRKLLRIGAAACWLTGPVLNLGFHHFWIGVLLNALACGYCTYELQVARAAYRRALRVQRERDDLMREARALLGSIEPSVQHIVNTLPEDDQTTENMYAWSKVCLFRKDDNFEPDVVERATNLLYSHLNEEQREQFLRARTFFVQGKSGRWYCLLPCLTGSVVRMADNQSFCIVPVKPVPVEDQMLATKLWLEADDLKFLSHSYLSLRWGLDTNGEPSTAVRGV